MPSVEIVFPPGKVAQAFNPYHWEEEAGKALWPQSRPGLHSKSMSLKEEIMLFTSA